MLYFFKKKNLLGICGYNRLPFIFNIVCGSSSCNQRTVLGLQFEVNNITIFIGKPHARKSWSRRSLAKLVLMRLDCDGLFIQILSRSSKIYNAHIIVSSRLVVVEKLIPLYSKFNEACMYFRELIN